MMPNYRFQSLGGRKRQIPFFSHHLLGSKVTMPLEFYLLLSFLPLSFAVLIQHFSFAGQYLFSFILVGIVSVKSHRIVKLFSRKYTWVVEQDL